MSVHSRVLVDRSQQKGEGAARGLAVLGPHLYWVDPKQQWIERVDKHTGQQLVHVVSRIEGLTAIAAVANITRKVSCRDWTVVSMQVGCSRTILMIMVGITVVKKTAEALICTVYGIILRRGC